MDIVSDGGERKRWAGWKDLFDGLVWKCRSVVRRESDEHSQSLFRFQATSVGTMDDLSRSMVGIGLFTTAMVREGLHSGLEASHLSDIVASDCPVGYCKGRGGDPHRRFSFEEAFLSPDSFDTHNWTWSKFMGMEL